MERSGKMKVTAAPIVMIPIMYKTSGKVSSTLQLRIRQAVNNPTDKGGVMPPTARFAIIATPKWIGSSGIESG